LQPEHQAWHCWTISFFCLGPMSDVTMLRRLCVGDLGHAIIRLMELWHLGLHWFALVSEQRVIVIIALDA
jgi:hypothetical protein